MNFKCYNKVRMTTNKYKDDGISIDSIGVILDIYDTGDYEVQFFDSDGELSNVFFSVKETDIILEEKS